MRRCGCGHLERDHELSIVVLDPSEVDEGDPGIYLWAPCAKCPDTEPCSDFEPAEAEPKKVA